MQKEEDKVMINENKVIDFLKTGGELLKSAYILLAENAPSIENKLQSMQNDRDRSQQKQIIRNRDGYYSDEEREAARERLSSLEREKRNLDIERRNLKK